MSDKINEVLQTQDFVLSQQMNDWLVYLLGGLSAVIIALFKFIQKERDLISKKLNDFSLEIQEIKGEIEIVKNDQKHSENLVTVKIENLTQKIEHYEKNNQLGNVALLERMEDIFELLQKKK